MTQRTTFPIAVLAIILSLVACGGEQDLDADGPEAGEMDAGASTAASGTPLPEAGAAARGGAAGTTPTADNAGLGTTHDTLER